jgi:methyl-accepting chemotaxis protein WspA
MSLARSRLALALTPALVTFVVIVLALIDANSLRQARLWVAHTRQVIHLADAVLISASEAEVDEMASVAMQDSALRVQEWNAVRDAQLKIDTLRELTKDNPRQRPRLDSLSREIAARFPAASAVSSGASAATRTAAAFQEMKGQMTLVRRLLADITGEEDRLLADRHREEARRVARGNVVLVLGGLVAIAIAVVVNVFLAGIITERERMANELVAQLGDLAKLQRELDARSGTKA